MGFFKNIADKYNATTVMGAGNPRPGQTWFESEEEKEKPKQIIRPSSDFFFDDEPKPRKATWGEKLTAIGIGIAGGIALHNALKGKKDEE